MTERPGKTGVFKTRAVIVAGLVDLLFGLSALILGAALVILSRHGSSVPLGLATSLVGLLLLLAGLSRTTARLEVDEKAVSWIWGFSRHEVPLVELEDAALVEKGSPASGASWAGYLGGGVLSVLAWKLIELVLTLFGSEPSLGSLDLVLIKHRGGPVEVRPISAWSTRSSHSEANQALVVVKAAIHAAAPDRAPEGPRILRSDAWETSN